MEEQYIVVNSEPIASMIRYLTGYKYYKFGFGKDTVYTIVNNELTIKALNGLYDLEQKFQ